MNRVDPLGLSSRPREDLFEIDLEQTNQILAEQFLPSSFFEETVDPVKEAIEDVASLVAERPISIDELLRETGDLLDAAIHTTPRDLLHDIGVDADFLKLNLDFGFKVPVGKNKAELFVSTGLDGGDVEAKLFVPSSRTNFGAGLKFEASFWGDKAGQMYLGPYGKHEKGTAKTSFEMKDLADKASPILKQELKEFQVGGAW